MVLSLDFRQFSLATRSPIVSFAKFLAFYVVLLAIYPWITYELAKDMMIDSAVPPINPNGIYAYLAVIPKITTLIAPSIDDFITAAENAAP